MTVAHTVVDAYDYLIQLPLDSRKNTTLVLTLHEDRK